MESSSIACSEEEGAIIGVDGAADPGLEDVDWVSDVVAV
jgi:hypothetical protein